MKYIILAGVFILFGAYFRWDWKREETRLGLRTEEEIEKEEEYNNLWP